MPPKEKAKELSINMCSPLDVFKPNLASTKRALICVDEIIKALDVLGDMGFWYYHEETKKLTDSEIESPQRYWYDVKSEIEKL